MLHTPWPVPTSMATVPLSELMHALWGITERGARSLNRTFGCSRITRPAYQAWSTWPLLHSHPGLGSYTHPLCNWVATQYTDSRQDPVLGLGCPYHAHWECGCSQRARKPRCTSISISTTRNCHGSAASYPVGHFGGNQLLGGSMSLSPLCVGQTSNLHVSIATIFHR